MGIRLQNQSSGYSRRISQRLAQNWFNLNTRIESFTLGIIGKTSVSVFRKNCAFWFVSFESRLSRNCKACTAGSLDTKCISFYKSSSFLWIFKSKLPTRPFNILLLAQNIFWKLDLKGRILLFFLEWSHVRLGCVQNSKVFLSFSLSQTWSWTEPYSPPFKLLLSQGARKVFLRGI